MLFNRTSVSCFVVCGLVCTRVSHDSILFDRSSAYSSRLLALFTPSHVAYSIYSCELSELIMEFDAGNGNRTVINKRSEGLDTAGQARALTYRVSGLTQACPLPPVVSTWWSGHRGCYTVRYNGLYIFIYLLFLK